MAIDKAIDSAQLDANLTSVADAIRTKGGTSAALTFPAGFVDAVEAIETGGGGGGEMYTGEFTPAENTLEAIVDIGQQYNYFLLWCNDTFTGTGLKAAGLMLVDATDLPSIMYFYGSTNNTGSSYMLYHGTSIATRGTDSYVQVVTNTRVTFYDDKSIKVTTSTAAGTSLGYFLAGITYHWMAW